MEPFDCAQDKLRGIQDAEWEDSPDFIRATTLLQIGLAFFLS